MCANVLGAEESIHFVASRCAVASVGFYGVAGFVFVASRTEILASRLRARPDCARGAICGDQFHVVILAPQADKVDRIRLLIAELLIHVCEQRLLTRYRPLVGRTLVTVDATIRIWMLLQNSWNRQHPAGLRFRACMGGSTGVSAVNRNRLSSSLTPFS